MAMKKIDLELAQKEYHMLMGKARSELANGFYRKAIELALSSWDHVDGMMQYERKYENKEFTNIEAIDMILKYGPILLDFTSLDALGELLKNKRRIDKNTSENITKKLDKAKKQMWDIHRMWSHLEHNLGARQDELRNVLGGNQDQWRSVAEVWEKMGLICRTPEGNSYRLSLLTRMGEIISAMCPSCGSTAEAPKAMFLEELVCPECHNKVIFVILPKEITTTTQE